jgi:hypothetical protein
MFRKFASSVLVLALLAGCGSTTASTDDCASAAAAIVENLSLGDHVEQVEDRVISGLFFFDEGTVTDAALYIANDKSADLVGVFDVTDVDSVTSKIQDYLTNLKAQMETYYPNEVFKIDNAVVMDNGSRVILIVAEDIEGAKSEASSLLGN